MATAEGNEREFKFTKDQEETLGTLAAYMKLVSFVLLAGGGALVLGGAACTVMVSLAWVLVAGEGLLYALLGLIMLAASRSVGYMVHTQGYEQSHMVNVLKDLSVFFQAQFWLVLAIVAVFVGRIVWTIAMLPTEAA